MRSRGDCSSLCVLGCCTYAFAYHPTVDLKLNFEVLAFFHRLVQFSNIGIASKVIRSFVPSWSVGTYKYCEAVWIRIRMIVASFVRMKPCDISNDRLEDIHCTIGRIHEHLCLPHRDDSVKREIFVREDKQVR